MKATLVLSILTLAFQVAAQPGLDKKNTETIIQNKIKSRTQYDDSYIDGKQISKNTRTSYIKYNKFGNVVEQITYKSKDTLTLEVYEYNSIGNRIEYTKHSGGSFIIAYKKLSTYDKNNNLILEAGYNGTENFKNVYEYDNKDRLIKIEYYLGGNQLDEKRTFINVGKKTTVNVYNAAGSLTSKIGLTHDKNDNLIEELSYGQNNQVLEKKNYTYNADNNLVEEIKYRLDKFYYKITYKYDNRDNIIEINEENPNEGSYVKKTYKYDSKGNLTEFSWRRRPSDDFSTKTFTYNSKNICTGVVTYYPGTKFKVLTRYTYEFY
jgi:hypothetical protein